MESLGGALSLLVYVTIYLFVHIVNFVNGHIFWGCIAHFFYQQVKKLKYGSSWSSSTLSAQSGKIMDTLMMLFENI